MENDLEQAVLTIELKQAPVIHHAMIEVGASVTKRINDLQIDKLIANETTVKSLKDLRAELTKELGIYESQRKAVKEAISKPYDDFKTVYDSEISAKFSTAISSLKVKIDTVEMQIKDAKKKVIEDYFINEACPSVNIDFLKFSDTKIDINLSTSEKKYKEMCLEFVQKVADDIALIETEKFAVEILVEYKKTLNASQSITEVRNRKQKEEEEKKRLEFLETERRKGLLIKLGFVFHDLTRSYNWIKDNNVGIELSELEKLTPDEFQSKYIEFEAKTKSIDPIQNNTQQPIVVQKTPEPLKTPLVESQNNVEKQYKATFEVTGSFEQLTALKQYLIDNNINYKKLEHVR